MHREFLNLPLEIQEHIRDEVPIFTRLSKNIYVGKHALLNICYENIQKNELLEYIDNHDVEAFMLYSTKMNDFFIDLYRLNPRKTFWGFEYGFKTYNKTRFLLQFSALSFFNILLIEQDMPNDLNIRDILKTYRNFDCDLSTALDIIKYGRTECNMIYDFNKSFVQHHKNKYINQDQFIVYNDVNKIKNKIIKLLYLLTNYCMLLLGFDEMIDGINRINRILSYIKFNKKGEIINDTGIKPLDQLYDLYLTELNNYIVKLL